MPRRFRRDHRDVNVCRWFDGSETNVEAVRKHQRLSGLQIRRNRFFVKFLLLRVRCENHDHVGPRGRFARRVDDKAVFLRLGAGGATCRQTNANIAAAIAQIQRVRVSL